MELWNGLGRLADITEMMLPPNPETWPRFWLYLNALGQTLAIACLGTLAAAILATGGTRPHAIRFGLLPQVLPVITSQVLYFFESNTRSATIIGIIGIGIVGAGGIGLHLAEQIRVLEWRQASFIILMVLITVAIIDQVSQRLRLAITGRRAS